MATSDREPGRRSTLRPDLVALTEWIAPGERVLDLGCGDGVLLRHLIDTKGVVGYGIENDPARIVACIEQLMALCDTLEQKINDATDKQTELLNAVMAQV